MSYWIYNPKSLISSRSLLLAPDTNNADVLNFLTLNMIFIYFYMKYRKTFQKYQKIFIASLLAIMTLGMLSGNKQTNYRIPKDMPKFNDYAYSLSID